MDDPMTYDLAVYICDINGGEIAVINNAVENELARLACGGPDGKCWLGLEEVGGDVWTPPESQIWRWRGVSEATYVNWHWGHPRNFNYTWHGGKILFDKRNAIMFCSGDEDNECVGEWSTYHDGADRPRPLCRMY